MKSRPQFQLRFRDEDQFLVVRGAADEIGSSMNEFVLRAVEFSLLDDDEKDAIVGSAVVPEPKKEGRNVAGVAQGVPSARKGDEGSTPSASSKKRIKRVRTADPVLPNEDFEDAIERQEQESKDWVKGEPGLTAADRIRDRIVREGDVKEPEVKTHSGHRVYKSGDGKYCSDCKEYF